MGLNAFPCQVGMACRCWCGLAPDRLSSLCRCRVQTASRTRAAVGVEKKEGVKCGNGHTSLS